MRTSRDLKSRILERTSKDADSGCWLWQGCRVRGYGHLQVGGRPRRVHRLAYAEFVGPIPPGLHVLHKCDTPACVNPEHLFLGTHADNMADRTRKGRVAHNKGERCGKSKLTEPAVEVARWMRFIHRMSYVRIAKAYNVTPGAIREACVPNRSWKHVPFHPKVAQAMEARV